LLLLLLLLLLKKESKAKAVWSLGGENNKVLASEVEPNRESCLAMHSLYHITHPSHNAAREEAFPWSEESRM
jgi:hypothetical protein